MRISKAENIWPPCTPRESDVREAIDYATISLPWTFDRMRYGPRSQNKVNERLLHILVGVLNQTLLERILTDRGFTCSKDWTKYRESDVFDFIIDGRTYDVKTVYVYSEYDKYWKREEFSVQLLISNRGYGGPEWRRFFPMMVATSQLTIDKMKDSYIFGITVTYEDFRKRKPKMLDGGFWCAAPFGKAHSFFHSTHVIGKREKENSGFRIRATWRRRQKRLVKEKRKAEIVLFGEWAGETQTEKLTIAEGQTVMSRSEFSSLSCLRLDHPAVLDGYDEIVVGVDNLLDGSVPKPANPLVNLNDPDFEWILRKDSFVNLRVPRDYKVYWIGFIPFTEFATTFPQYESYFVPHPKSMDVNQPGRANAKLLKRLASLDKKREKAIQNGINVPWPAFSQLVSRTNEISAGILLAAMRGLRPIGAACYFYPPYALWESALYVLPGDLYPMNLLDEVASSSHEKQD